MELLSWRRGAFIRAPQQLGVVVALAHVASQGVQWTLFAQVPPGGQTGRGNAAAEIPNLPYQLVEWPTRPTGAAGVHGAWNFIQVASVAITPRGTILVLHRGAHPINRNEVIT
jgi:hypothetical protein